MAGFGARHAFLLRKQEVAHLELRFVELRFGVDDGAAQQLGNLVMLIAFDLMQGEDRSAAFWKFLGRSGQGNVIDRAGEGRIVSSEVAPQRRLWRQRLVNRERRSRFSAAKLHQHGVYGNTVQPGGERRIASEAANGAKDLQECLLGQVFCLGDVFGHNQAHRIHALLMHLKESSKSLLIAVLRALDKAALGIVPAGFPSSRNYFRFCRGNYASRHGSLSFDAYLFALLDSGSDSAFDREPREIAANVLSGSLCNCRRASLYGEYIYFLELSGAETATFFVEKGWWRNYLDRESKSEDMPEVTKMSAPGL